jgi:hypothetical protein
MKITQFFRLNLIALKLNNHYKLNIYLLLILFICIISSVIFRSALPIIELSSALPTVPDFGTTGTIIMQLLIIFTTIYALKLMSDLIIRIIQAFKIIPEFIKMYHNNMLNIKSIISLYYIQNILFMLLSIWILYILFNKLSLFIDGIYLFIICFGIVGSINFYYAFPNLFSFNISQTFADYSIYVYLLFIFFIVFYMFIFPLMVINIVNSDKFITYFATLNNKLINDVIKNTFNYMNNPTNNFNTQIENSHNRIIVSSSSNLPVSNNFNTNVINNDNSIQIIKIEDGRQIILNTGLNNDNISTLETSSASHTGRINTGEATHSQSIGSSRRSGVQRSTVSAVGTHNNRTTPFGGHNNILKLLKRSISIFNLKQHNFDCLNDYPRFKISINKYEELLLTSYQLRNYMVNNAPLIYNQEIFNYIYNIIDELKLFLNIQLKIEELNKISNLPIEAFNNSLLPAGYDSLLENYTKINQLFTEHSFMPAFGAVGAGKADEKFNKELFNILIKILPDNNLTLNKLKEFYVLNDLDYLNSQTKKLIHINFYDNHILLRQSFLENLKILEESPMQTERVNKLAYYYMCFNDKYYELMESFDKTTTDNIKWKYNKGLKPIKNYDHLKKIRLTQFYHSNHSLCALRERR